MNLAELVSEKPTRRKVLEMFSIASLGAFCPLIALAEERTTLQDPILINDKRKTLTCVYANFHYGIDTWKLLEPQAVIVHATNTATYSAAHNTFYSETLNGRKDISGAGAVNVSAHYIIDRDGKVYQQAPLDFMCRHAIGYNHVALGIENVSTPERLFTEEQVQANAWLIAKLVDDIPSVRLVFAHKDYARKPQLELVKAVGDPYYIPAKRGKQDPYENDFEKVLAALPSATKDVLAARNL